MRILHQALPEDEVLRYIAKLTGLREEHKQAALTAGECSEAAWEGHFLKEKYDSIRLTHMRKFIQDCIGVQRLFVTTKEMSLLGTKPKTSRKGSRPEQGDVHLTNNQEKWLCKLCKTSHRSK